MYLRDVTAEDLPAIVDIYNSAVPTRVSTADTEPIPVEARLGWFNEHEPSRRPIWVMEDEGEVVGWLSLSDFYDAAPPTTRPRRSVSTSTQTITARASEGAWSKKPSGARLNSA